MKETKQIIIDGKTYISSLSTKYNNNTYYYLINLEDAKDVCIRKLYLQDNEEYLIELDDDQELNNVFKKFIRLLDL